MLTDTNCAFCAVIGVGSSVEPKLRRGRRTHEVHEHPHIICDLKTYLQRRKTVNRAGHAMAIHAKPTDPQSRVKT